MIGERDDIAVLIRQLEPWRGHSLVQHAPTLPQSVANVSSIYSPTRAFIRENAPKSIGPDEQ
jgi:hypothetical protein